MVALETLNDRRKQAGLPAYFLLAFGIAWSSILLIAFGTGLPARPGTPETSRYLMFLGMLAGPSVASLVLTAVSTGRSGLGQLWTGLRRWRVGARWYLAVLVAPGIFALVVLLVSPIVTTAVPPIARDAAAGPLILAALAGGLGAGIFEELGWTGFATPRLVERHGWLRAGLLLGVIWAAWHGLGDYWGGAAWGARWSLHFAEWVLALTAFRVLMTWVYAHTGSLLLAVLLHAGSTGTQILLWPASAPAQELAWYGTFAFGLALVAALVALRGRPELQQVAIERRAEKGENT